MSRFVFIAPLSSLSRRTRLFKISKFVNTKNGGDILHIGWERINGEAKETELDFKVTKRIILKGGGYGGGRIKLYYFVWMLKVFFNSFNLKKSDRVWALGFESAFPLLLSSKIIGYKLFFDDADRFSMLFNFPSAIKSVLQYLEKITSRNVHLHIIPVKERYNFDSSKFHILQNFPSESEMRKAKEIYLKSEYIKNKLVINVNGWLGESRGMDIIKKLCLDKIDGISFILAGKLDSTAAKEIINEENVQYLGEVSNSSALASYLASDFVFTFYKPSSTINTLAASNKWGDAIMSKIGVIVNEEVVTAKYLIDANVAVYCRYANYAELKSKLISLVSNPDFIIGYKKNSEILSRQFGYFEKQLDKIIS